MEVRESAHPDFVTLDPARRLLFSYTISKYLESKPPSTVVSIEDPRGTTIAEAVALLHRHNISSAPVVDTKNYDFMGFISSFDIIAGLIAGSDPSLFRQSYNSTRTLEQRMEELDAVAEDFYASPVSKLHPSADGKLVYRGHVTATLLDLVSHGFFQHKVEQRSATHQAAGEDNKGKSPSETKAAAPVGAGSAREYPPHRPRQVCHRVAIFEADEGTDAMRIVVRGPEGVQSRAPQLEKAVQFSIALFEPPHKNEKTQI